MLQRKLRGKCLRTRKIHHMSNKKVLDGVVKKHLDSKQEELSNLKLSHSEELSKINTQAGNTQANEVEHLKSCAAEIPDEDVEVINVEGHQVRVDKYASYRHNDAPIGYVYEDTIKNIKGLIHTKPDGTEVSLQGYLFSGLKIIKPSDKLEERYGPYTKQQVMNNLNLMRVYMPHIYEEEVWNIMKNNDGNRSNRTGQCLGGRQRFRR